MIKYKIYKIENHNRINVETPYEFLGDIFMGNETPTYIQKMINGIRRVKNKEEEDFYFRNEAGFFADMDTEDDGVYIFDEFSKDPTKELFIIPFDEMIKLLEDFKEFLEKESEK
jgi:hypothetical protein